MVNTIRALSHDTLARIHGTGLLIIIFASFFPVLIHGQVYLFFGLLALSATVAWSRGRALWVRTDTDVPLLLFIGWILLTVPFATDPTYSFEEWRKLVAQGLVFYWAQFVLHNFRTQQMTRHVVLTVAVGATVISGVALFIFLIEGGSLLDRDHRAKVLFSDANWLATYLILVIPIIVSGLGMAGQRRWKIFLAWALGITLAALYCSYMRAGWLALMVMGISWGLIVGNHRLVYRALGISIGFLAIIVGLHQFGFFSGVINTESMIVRLELWEEAIRRLSVHPIIGNGYGQLTEQVRLSTSESLPSQSQGLHSLFLMVGVGSGVPALIMLLWFVQRSVRELHEQAHAGADPDQRAFAAGAAVMMIGFMVRNLFDYMFAGSLAYLFWILLAVGLGSRSTGDDHAVREGGQPGVAR